MRDLAASSVAIAGCGAISAVGSSVESLHNALQINSSGLRASERFSSPRFQSNIVGAAPRNVDDDNPAWFLTTEALNEARESAQKI